MGKGITPRFGMGKGKVVDLDSADAVGQLVEWAAAARAGHRLLITSSTRKEIKKRNKCISGMAKEYGLRLQWRYGREVKLVDKYVHPETILVRETQYQAWVLVKAVEVLAPTAEDKNSWLFDSVIRQLNRDEREIGEYPAWVHEMEPSEDGKEADGLVTQEEREQWDTDRGSFTLDGLFDDPTAVVQSLDGEL
jgi:hypothetical protein